MIRLLAGLIMGAVLAGSAGASPTTRVADRLDVATLHQELATARLYADRLERKVSAQVNRAERNERKLRRERREHRAQLERAAGAFSIHRMISAAATAYGQSYSMLLRKADCESGLWPFARNRSSNASGLFQFLPSTWDSTPFRRHSIWDPWAQSLAASWMHSHLRGGEWACR